MNNNVNNSAPSEFEIRLITDWPVAELVELYKAGGWWREGYDPEGIHGLIRGSFAFALVLDTTSNKAVGMGRVISDGVSDGYIQDVVVLKAWRGKGLGIKIVKTLLNYCLENNLHWIGLVAEPGTRSFYTPLGFKTLPGEPMVYQP
ncbi:GNAT family N-acetyltransferase [[Eubacterium] cellulosolvens]